MEHEKITRSAAMEAGLKYYFTGVPCPKGHIDLRHVRKSVCRACRKKGRRAASHAYNRAMRKHYRKGTLQQSLRLELKNIAIAYLGGKCKDCGWSGHQAGFEFDHVKGREYRLAISIVISRISRYIDKGVITQRHKDKLIKEISNDIDLVCGTCHNIRTWNQRH